MEYISNSIVNAIPHSAFILTKEKNLKQFDATKIIYPYAQAKACNELYRNMPWEIEIHLTNNCPLKCKGCSYGTRVNNDEITIEMLDDFFEKLDFEKIKSIFFSGGGDPLFWNQWDYIASRKKDLLKEIPIGISTNIIGLKKIKDINIFDFLQIHIVGFDRESCISEVGVDCFDIIMKNLDYLMKNKATANIALKFLINDNNVENLHFYLDFIEKYNADSIIIKIEQNFIANANENSRIFGKSKNITEIILNHDICDQYEYAINNLDDVLWNSIVPRECYICTSGLYYLVRPNGSIFPCIASTYNEQNAIGNILNYRHPNKIDMKKYTELMKLGQCPTKACRHYRFNKIIDLYEQNQVQVCDQVIPILI